MSLILVLDPEWIVSEYTSAYWSVFWVDVSILACAGCERSGLSWGSPGIRNESRIPERKVAKLNSKSVTLSVLITTPRTVKTGLALAYPYNI